MKKIITILLLTITVLTLSGCKPSLEDEILFDLIGGEQYSIELNVGYVEPGFIVRHNTTNLSEYVTITGYLDFTTPGEYTLDYTLDYEGITIIKQRIINVGSFNTNCSTIENSDLLNCSIIWTNYLNTIVKLSIYLEPDSSVNTDDVFDEIDDMLAYYNIMSDKYKSYDGMMNVNEINATAGQTVTVHEDLFDLIKFTLDHQDEVNNLFNSALGPVLQIWHDYREDCELNDICAVPSLTILNEANQYTDASKVILDTENHTLTMEENMSLDLGGVSKGYVSKKIIEYLDTLDIHGFLLNNGESNISVGGEHPTRDNKKFVIAVSDPTFALQYYATIYLQDGEQLVTSGDYQKYFEVDGQKYHHIIHPTTLMPEYNSRSVSIITSDPALADLYSTAIFNMTIAEGKVFVNDIDGLEAIWYGNDGKISFSDNFESRHLIDTFE